MLNLPNGINLEYKYNCFENDKAILDEIWDLYEHIYSKCKNVRNTSINFIPIALEILGYKVLYHSLRTGYQGDAIIVFENYKNGNIYTYETSYGSCEYCDIWQQEFLKDTFYDEARTSKEFYDIIDFLCYAISTDDACYEYIEDDIIRKIKFELRYVHKPNYNLKYENLILCIEKYINEEYEDMKGSPWYRDRIDMLDDIKKEINRINKELGKE
jgi:hypothetical protein